MLASPHAAWTPPWPDDVPPEHVGQAISPIRYEDLAQDGRAILGALPHSVGTVVWRGLVEKMPGAQAALAAGLVPILTRLVIDGGDEPMSARDPFDFTGCFAMAHAGDGDARKILLNIWTTAHGPRGHLYGPPPAGAGERVEMGRVFAEHTFTRLFAPPGQRRVNDLAGIAGLPAVPPAVYDWRPPAELLALPAGAVPLEPMLAPDDTALALGLVHTDANQHVNSLVYPRLFEEAALRRFARLGRPTNVLARRLTVAYRKPMFAGQSMRIVMQVFEPAGGGAIGAVGAFMPEGVHVPREKAHAFARLMCW